ncbi:hypothetical protein E2C01_099355 [Portunus trituberculatus]|uniref:Uncharacterized protein n=1 Tax=Portunus trituberculatus TaxID=210409 RepID=A0A5B7KA54_PORTR|nr:hypothetical protein [Portunus trituberculatus]
MARVIVKGMALTSISSRLVMLLITDTRQVRSVPVMLEPLAVLFCTMSAMSTTLVLPALICKVNITLLPVISSHSSDYQMYVVLEENT